MTSPPAIKSGIEPGLLQVFRLYAWLRVASMLIGIRLASVSAAHAENSALVGKPDIPWYVPFNVLLLLGILYIPGLPKRLGRYYIPITLIFAASSLILEEHLLLLRHTTWQLHPFLNILLILVAWQYGYASVFLFTLGTAVFEIGLVLLLPVSPAFLLPFEPSSPHMSIWLVISRSATFLVIGYVVSRLVQSQRHQREVLAEANRKLVSHAATLEHLATSRERVRLSRDLHDTLAHTLSALAVQFEAVLTLKDTLPPRVQAMLERMQYTTRSGLDETRRALTALRASPLEELGLSAALRVLAQDIAARQPLELTFDMIESADNLPVEVEQTFYRVAQEALVNVSRHAHARKLEVSLHDGRGRLELCIQDDGQGFDPRQDDDERKFGLRGMRERAALIGARLQLESTAGYGSTVRLVWESPS